MKTSCMPGRCCRLLLPLLLLRPLSPSLAPPSLPSPCRLVRGAADTVRGLKSRIGTMLSPATAA